MATPKQHLTKKIKILAVLLVVAAIGLKLWQFHWSTAVLELKGQVLHVLVAKTIYQQQKGLGGRASLAPYDGMLFVFSFSAQQVFVMRGMEFPIDIVWFNHGTVVDIAKNVPVDPVPEESLKRYYPRTEASAVIELPAGWADQHELKIGDRLKVVEE